MKIIVCSDSHGNTDFLETAIKAEKPDRILHLGDCVQDALKLQQLFPELPVHYVSGNCDHYVSAPTEEIIMLDGVRIFMTHGHRFQVKYMYLRAVYAALEENAQLLLFGHTHRAEIFEEKGLWAMNPGAARNGSYGIIEISNGTFQLKLGNEH